MSDQNLERKLDQVLEYLRSLEKRISEIEETVRRIYHEVS